MSESEKKVRPTGNEDEDAAQPDNGPAEEPEQVQEDEAAASENTPSTVPEKAEGLPADPYGTPTVDTAPKGMPPIE